MSTVTAHTLFNPVRTRYSPRAGATSLGCPTPALVSLHFAPNSGRKNSRLSVRCSAPATAALLLPASKSVAISSNDTKLLWEFKKGDDNTVKVVLFLSNIPGEPKKDDFKVTVEGDVLQISSKGTDNFDVQLQLPLPGFYVKEPIKAVLENRSLTVTIAKDIKTVDVEEK